MKRPYIQLLSIILVLQLYNSSIVKAEDYYFTHYHYNSVKPAIPPGTIVAKVNGKNIMLGDYYRQHPGEDLLAEDDQKSGKTLPILIESIIHQHLLSEAGKKDNIPNDKDVKQEIQRNANMVIIRAYFTKKIKDKLSEQSLKDRYKRFIETYNYKPDRLLVISYIFAKSEKIAWEILKKLENREDFGDIENDYFIETTTLYLKPPQGEHKNLIELTNIAHGMKDGTVYHKPIKFFAGYIVFSKEREHAIEPPSYENHRYTLMREISKEVVTEIVSQLAKNVKIERLDLKTGQVDNTTIPIDDIVEYYLHEIF